MWGGFKTLTENHSDCNDTFMIDPPANVQIKLNYQQITCHFAIYTVTIFTNFNPRQDKLASWRF